MDSDDTGNRHCRVIGNVEPAGRKGQPHLNTGSILGYIHDDVLMLHLEDIRLRT